MKSVGTPIDDRAATDTLRQVWNYVVGYSLGIVETVECWIYVLNVT